MSMMMDDHRCFLVKEKEPLWMREERYNYCDPYFEGLLFEKAPRRRRPQIHSILSRFFHN